MESVWVALMLSLKIAFWATMINVFFGVSLGYLLARKNLWAKELIDTILTLPMVMPPTVLGYYLLVLIGKNGAIGRWLEQTFDINLIFTWQGAVIAAALVSFPLVFKPARVAFETSDMQLEQAAKVLGISNLGIFFRITLPLAWRGIMAGVLLAFARSLGEFGATLMVAGSIPGQTQTLSIAVYEAVQSGDDHLANSLVCIISVVCIALLLLISKLLSGKKPLQHLK